MVEKPDSNLVVVMGRSESEGVNLDDNLLIIEIDGSSGNIIDNLGKQLSANGRLLPHQIISTDTSIIIGGELETNTDRNVFLAELNIADYRLIRQAWFGKTNQADYYGNLLPTSDGGFLLGWMQTGVYPEYFGLLKLDKNFHQEWKEGLYAPYARASSRSRMKLLEIPNCEGYMILAGTDEYANSVLLQINTLGNVQWAKRYIASDALGGQGISFQDMAWDGHNGVTLLGINGTKLNSNGYPEYVDYQVLNVDYAGQMHWQRKVADLKVTIPTAPSYNLYVTKLMQTGDGGYLAAIPGNVGDEVHLVKFDSMGMDGCVMTNTNISEEERMSFFSVDLNIQTTLDGPTALQSTSDYSFNIAAPTVNVSSLNCGLVVGGPVIAAFSADDYTIPVDQPPTIHNLSTGAT